MNKLFRYFYSRLHLMRELQIRGASLLLVSVQNRSHVEHFVEHLSHRKTIDLLSRMIFGYRRIFSNLEAAESAAKPYEDGGHEALEALHLELSNAARPSDFAILFHLAQFPLDHLTIFDLGGSLGNLYYCYARYLHFGSDVKWIVFDLPTTVAKGRTLAQTRGATQLEFCDSFECASGADVLLASGSLHYFPTPLPAMIGGLAAKPRYVLINRTPLVDAPTAATVQDAGPIRVACMLYNVDETIAQFERIGYRLVDQWRTPELWLGVPLHPEYSMKSYRGLMFELAAQAQAGGATEPLAAA